MPGMLPIDRVRRVTQQARERFDRARRRFGVKRADLGRKARTYDDNRTDRGRDDDGRPPREDRSRP